LRVASHFLGLPAGDVRDTLRGLRFSNADVNAVARICDAWTAAGPELCAAAGAATPPSDAQVRRWIATVTRTQWTLVMRMVAAVCAVRGGVVKAPPAPFAVAALYRRGLRIAFRDPLELADLAVDGDDLRAAGVGGGPAIGRWLQRLLDMVIDDPEKNQRRVLLDVVARGDA
jgi:tRNA nucleotidyltransferase (CCA-adding enzyme)